MLVYVPKGDLPVFKYDLGSGRFFAALQTREIRNTWHIHKHLKFGIYLVSGEHMHSRKQSHKPNFIQVQVNFFQCSAAHTSTSLLFKFKSHRLRTRSVDLRTCVFFLINMNFLTASSSIQVLVIWGFCNRVSRTKW